jgi:adenylate cyclase
MQDVFEIQQDIACAVAAALRLTFNHESSPSVRRCHPQAYELLLRGNSLLARRNLQEIISARQLFFRSLEADPECGRAWEGLAASYGYEYLYFNATEHNLEQALEASARAVEMLPQRAQSHVLSGIANTMARNYGKADDSFRRALDLDPDCFEACYFRARMKVREGDLQKALACFERAGEIRQDDYESVLLQAQLHIGLGNVAQALVVSRDGIERVRRALALNPSDNRALCLGAFALLRLGEQDEAEDWMRKSMRNAPSDSIVRYNAACFYALKGETETALDCLESCRVKVGQVNREWLEHDSDLDSIRDHPRFPAIVASITAEDSG